MPLPRAIRLMVFLLLLALIASGMLTRSAHGSQVRGPSEHVHATGTVDFSDQLILSGSYASALPRGLGLSTDGNVIGFTGHVFDAETGLLLARLRVHDAVVLGRWLSRDPAGFVDGMNLYVYVRGNPLVWWDPLGMSVWGGLLSLGLGYGYNPDATVGDILRGTGSATVTGAKAVVNGVSQAGVNLVTLGLGPDNVEVWRVNDCDRDNDYDLARGFAMVGGEILTGVLTGGASYASKVGTAVRTIDQAGNVVMAARGAADMLDEGITAENSLRLAGGTFGFGANSVARRAAMGRGADDALTHPSTTLALPGPQVEAHWGALNTYRHGVGGQRGQMTAIEHINFRHAYDSGFSDVSRFSNGTSVRSIKSYVDDALRFGTVSPGRGSSFTIEHNLGRSIGTNAAGDAASSIRVHVRDGQIQTAYPF